MTATSNISAYDDHAATPEGARELAAARLAILVSELVEEAFEKSGLTNREFAEALGVTDGRASQILNSDGNLRIATLAKALEAMNFTPSISAVSPDGVQVPAPRPKRRRRGAERRTWEPRVETTLDLYFAVESGSIFGISCAQVDLQHVPADEIEFLSATDRSSGRTYQMHGKTTSTEAYPTTVAKERVSAS